MIASVFESREIPTCICRECRNRVWISLVKCQLDCCLNDERSVFWKATVQNCFPNTVQQNTEVCVWRCFNEISRSTSFFFFSAAVCEDALNSCAAVIVRPCAGRIEFCLAAVGHLTSLMFSRSVTLSRNVSTRPKQATHEGQNQSRAAKNKTKPNQECEEHGNALHSP